MSLLRMQLNANEIAAELDNDGFVTIENALDEDWLKRAQSYIGQLIEKKGRVYFSLNGLSREPGTPAYELANDPAMMALMADLSKLGCPTARLEDEIYSCLRVVAGASGDEKSLIHHYDKYVITILAPILIPEGLKRQAGELVLFPNRRGYRPFAWLNILEKAIVQSGWYRRRFTEKLLRGGDEAIRHLKPGNLYLFWGYRTYHSNFPVARDSVRATLLLHYGDPHPDSFILNAVRSKQISDERKILPQKEWH